MRFRLEVHKGGALIGWTTYQTSVDIWEEAVYSDEYCIGKPKGKWTCDDQDHKHEEGAQVGKDKEWYPFRWCEACYCLVSPPFDGYAYHEYDCEMDESCECDVV